MIQSFKIINLMSAGGLCDHIYQHITEGDDFQYFFFNFWNLSDEQLLIILLFDNAIYRKLYFLVII